MKKPVLVLGGGIAGIQAATDLAEMGVPVFLVDPAPCIGGRMAELDKTFPTGDCSACILAPKLTTCANHPLICLLTLSELVELRGNAPHFTAVIRQNPRYVDEEKCKGCDDCTAVCPIQRENAFDQGYSSHQAIYKPYPQAVPNKAVIEKRGASPCKTGCPAHMDAHGYMALAARGRYAEALKVVRRCSPFAGVLGRVCFHPCEAQCTRRYLDAPLGLAGVKRFLADVARQSGEDPGFFGLTAEAKPQKIAIVGAGPAGLNCAYQLALAGYRPQVFECEEKSGGMLRYGIPDFRLDKTILDEEIALVQSLGVSIQNQKRLGKDFTLQSLKEEGYEAIFVAIGAQRPRPCGLRGEAGAGVVSGLHFLRDVNRGTRPSLGKKVAVIGGGNVAIDAARAARRLGAEVCLLYRRSRAEIPAAQTELRFAEEEGVELLELVAPLAVLRQNGAFTGLCCRRNTLGPPDATGRRSPEPLPGSDFTLAADTLITAVGQMVDEDGLPDTLPRYHGSGGALPKAAEQAGIFTGGDMLRGPATVIEAIADGNRAALAIRRFLGEKYLAEETLLPQTPYEAVNFKGARHIERQALPALPAAQRLLSFAECEAGYAESDIQKEAARCLDCSVCSECRLCQEACTSGAILHGQQPRLHQLEVGAVVVATGCNITTKVPPAYGLGHIPGVISNLAYERMLSSSGPVGGHLVRPEDGRVPKRVAFLHCVGSRDAQCGADYCSSVCCMQAVKAAAITAEHLPGLEKADLYYMDMRAYGKDFERFVQDSLARGPISLIRSRASGCSWDAETGEVILHYCSEAGERRSARYDMVVLQLGLRPGADNRAIARNFGVTTDRYNFFRGQDFPAPKTQRKGFFACGAGAGPKDIPETVVEASASAAGAARFVAHTQTDLYAKYGAYFRPPTSVPQRDISKEPVRIGVFVCRCGANIAGVIDIAALARYAEGLPFVAHVEDSVYSCSADAQKVIAARIAEKRLNRVVVASCTPRTHQPLFRSVLEAAGLAPSLFAMANIRDQCAWVHSGEGQSATAKAKDLVSMAVARVFLAKQLRQSRFEVVPSALVLGGGPAGLAAAVYLTRMGHTVHLVEKEARYGGNARRLALSSAGRPLWPHIEEMLQELQSSGLCHFYPSSQLTGLTGHVGNFTCFIQTPEGEKSAACGAIIVATGGQEATPNLYLYGQNPFVITHRTLEDRLYDPAKDLSGIRRIVMIQCAGSRCEERPYCSRLCCGVAVRNALRIKQHDASIEVTVLFREMRTYGTADADYTAARAAGVEFIRFEDERPPRVSEEPNGLRVEVFDPILGRDITLWPSLLSLAAAVEPDKENNRRLAQLLKVSLNTDGFFLEAHAKLRPVDFATEGVFLAGLAHSPRTLREAVVQGRAAAARAATILAKEELVAEGETAGVNPALCSGCGSCKAVCPYGAISLAEAAQSGPQAAQVSEVLCKGCGSCAAACRCGAIDLADGGAAQVLSELSALLSLRTQ